MGTANSRGEFSLTNIGVDLRRHKDVVDGSHVDLIGRWLLLAARFKEFPNCGDITYFHGVLLKVENTEVHG